MFTGIVEAIGKVTAIERGHDSVRLSVSSAKIAEDIALGDSVSVDGVCLTAVEFHPPQVTFEAVYETLRRSTLGNLSIGDTVNLERALLANGRLGGHIVQGHIDGTGRIASIRPIGDSYWVYVDVAPEIMRYIVGKGSVAVNGVSLTVAESADRTFALSVIPHTWDGTTLKHLRAGDSVNVECDILGKYVEKMLGGYIATGGDVPGFERRSQGVTVALLTRSGYIDTGTSGGDDW